MPTGLTVIKRFTYRGDANEEFSNTYWFTGTTPTDATAWAAFATEIATAEKTLYNASVRIVRYYGYNDDTDARVAIWSGDITATPILGSIPGGGLQQAAGDAAVWIRWQTSRLTSRGKKIYLRKYYHPAYIDTADVTGNTVLPAQKTAMTAFGTKMMDGSLTGARKLTARGHTDVLTASSSSLYVTTRTLKRRGKRPGS